MLVTINVNEEELNFHLKNLDISKKVIGKVVQGAEHVVQGLASIEQLIKVLQAETDTPDAAAGIPHLEDILDLGEDERAVGLFNVATPHVDRAVRQGRISGVAPPSAPAK